MTLGRLAECYSFEDLVKLALPLVRCYRLQPEVGPEDVANAVLYHLWRAAAARKTPELEPGGDSRKFAGVLLARVVLQARRQARSIRRGGSGRDTACAGGDGSPSSGSGVHRVALDLDSLQAVGPAAVDLVDASMEEEDLTERLGEAELKQIVRMRLDEYTVGEIAREIGRGHATVSRKLLQIQTIWQQSRLNS